ncbi:hypothetical protein NDU88_000830 [Pleurodeles waltl]|uniref:Uncharacterized protein n=1 Tax=Pleurodeles waltl TaxID=8319 RepID=A0AAV7N961_PLEWA|nr:hypothetical protein NDU88_000830 [Pleurodeles waltl]
MQALSSLLMEKGAITIWEHYISAITGIQKQLNLYTIGVEHDLLRLETMAVSSTEGRRQLGRARWEHTTLLEHLHCLNYNAHSAWTHSGVDKSCTLLAWLVRQEDPQRPILSVTISPATELHTQRKIHVAFAQHYESLYTAVTRIANTAFETFLADANLPQVPPDEALELTVDITPFEIREAIQLLALGKTLGPDGHSQEFYKTRATLLVPHLQILYNKAFLCSFLPQ